MERNADDMPATPREDAVRSEDRGAMSAGGATNSGGSVAGQGGYGNTGDESGTAAYGIGSAGTPSALGGGATERTGTIEEHRGLADRAGSAAETAKDKLADVGSAVKEKAADVGSTVREKAGSAKNSLADMLESGADKLRQRSQGGTLAAADAAGGTTAVSTDKVAQATDKLAGGMQATADWLREADLDNLRSGIETQVREHPGRTLLIALGAGYLLGKAFRK